MLPDCEKMGAFQAAACTDCHAVPSMTSQCTDQCVVVACSDPPVCEMACPGNHCDLVCEDASNCRDCNGFDEFLQCCTDFHSYYEEPRNHPETIWSWDPSLKTFVCSCGGGSTGSIPSSWANLGGSSSIFDAVDARVSPSHHSTSPPPALPVPRVSELPALTCMWGECGVSFSNISDLAEHVNLLHLRHPPSPSLPPSSDSRDLFAMSCQWKDCSIYPTPNSIPGPSSGDIDSILGMLSSHLLHDHLGLSKLPSYTQDISPPESHHNQSHPNSPSSLPDSAAPSSHELQASHACQWLSCGQSFSSLEDVTLHLVSVHVGAGKATYDCYWQDCPRHGESGFTSKQKLCRHLQSHTGHRPFQCKICLQNFSEAATLQQHMRRHTHEKPYVCDYPGCGKSFAITGALTIHKRTHNGHKPFKCPHCDKAFSESSNLSKHLRTHTGARPYTCVEPGCTKAFARADQLTRHNGVHSSCIQYAE
ncbi:hypothetical protein B0H10DRAFT_1000391 [Mycena sp. CBHHK59/15]|nr:hypothetical protein B0H10DRAFT_1000391 [Mycena sp. CBHHK59/15]